MPLHLFVFTGCGLVALGRGGKGAERQDIAAPPQPCAHPISAPQHSLYLYFVFFVFVFVTLQLLLNLVPTPSLLVSIHCILYFVFFLYLYL